MADYKFVKYCLYCKKRYIVQKGESKSNYCEACRKKFFNEQNQTK